MIIYSKGQTEIARMADYSYSGTFMGERYIQGTVNSPIPIDFLPDDWVEFRNERLILDYIPTVEKNASDKSAVNAYSYSLKLVSLKYELERCIMTDIVLNDNNVHYTGLPTFSFFGNAQTLADRIIANLNRLYTGEKAWTIEVLDVGEEKNLSFDATNCWNAVSMFKNEFDLNFIFQNRKITVGTAGSVIGHTFEYGKGNGLYQITRTSVDSSAIITRLKAYGSDRNLPRDYNKKNAVPESQYITKLMLPNYSTSLIDYVDSNNINIYGIREGVQFFDDIYPSIEDTKADDLLNAGIETSASGRLDEIVKVSEILNPEQSYFNVWIKDIGFNINEYLTPTTAIFSVKDGRLGGYEFEITNCVTDTSVEGAKYRLTLNRNQDDNFIIPDAIINMQPGDHFVLLEIYMPEVYVLMAEQRLLNKAKEYLGKYDHAQTTYAISIDELFLAKNLALGEIIQEGNLLHIVDKGLGIDQNIIIQSLSIQYSADEVPVYDITLSDQPVATTLDRVQDDIGSIEDTIINKGTAYEKDIRRNVIALNRTKDRVFDTDGNINGGNIAPNSVTTNALSIGAKSRNFVLNMDIKPNYNGNPNLLCFGNGQLIHRELKHGEADIDANYIWQFLTTTETLADSNKDYYIYAKCSKSSSVASWHITEDMLRYDDDAEYYYLLIGDIYAVTDNVRSENFYYGKTWINGRFLYTGTIMGAAGKNGSYWDLDNNLLYVGNAKGLENFSEWNENMNEIASGLGYANFQDFIAKAAEGRTIIIGGLINTNLINTEALKVGDKVLIAEGKINAELIEAVNLITDEASIANVYFSNGSLIVSENSPYESLNGRFGFYEGSIESIGRSLLYLSHKRYGECASIAVLEGNIYSLNGTFNGFRPGTRQINTTTYLVDTDNYISCYNSSAITIYLPPSPKLGHTLFIRKNNNQTVTVAVPNTSVLINYDRTDHLYDKVDIPGINGDACTLHFDGSSWLFNRLER